MTERAARHRSTRPPAWLQRFLEIGALPTDSDELRARKAGLVLSAALMAALSCVWVVTYAALGLWVSALIPFAYQVATAISLVTFARTRRYVLFRRSQLLLPLVLPFALQWSLGGFENSSGVALWAITSPVGALVFVGARQAVPWFLAFAGLVVVSAAIDPALAADAPEIPQGVQVAFFALNILGVATTVFAVLEYFVRARERALADLAEQHRVLEQEQAKSERLLLNVLPAPIAARLKEHEEVIADDLPAVTVLFADIVGFTPLSERARRLGGRLAPGRGVRTVGRARRPARRGEDQDDRRRVHGRGGRPAPARRPRGGDRGPRARHGTGAGAVRRGDGAVAAGRGSASTAGPSSPA